MQAVAAGARSASIFSAYALHVARPPFKQPTVLFARHFSSSSPRCKPHLVILGSGWGGYEVLRGVDKNRWSSYLPRL